MLQSLPTAAKYLSVQLDAKKSVKHEACKRSHETYGLQFTCKAKWNLREYLEANGMNRECYPMIIKSTQVTEKLST